MRQSNNPFTVEEVVAGVGEVDVEGVGEMSLTMIMGVATMHNAGDTVGEIRSWKRNLSDPEDYPVPLHIIYNSPNRNRGVVGSYQELYKTSTSDLIMYLHDDVICREGNWDERVLAEFDDPKVGIVGFGGAIRHGSPDLYKVPYRLQDLARFGYMSNVDDAEVHGERMEGSREVAVLDGFALCIRRSLIDRVNGWLCLTGNCDFFCYDYAICALARRLGYSVRVVGVRCHHLGGRTSVGKESGLREITGQDAYDKAHRWFYEEFRDVMPYEVPHVRS